MNWLDIAIVVVIAAFVLSAYSAGLIREVITFIAAIVGIVVAGLLYDKFARDVLVFISDQDAAKALAFLILSGAVYLMGQILAYVLKKAASLMMLGPADHIGGAFFGLLKALFVVEILLILFAAYPNFKLDSAIRGSGLAPYFIDDGSVLLHVLPGEFGDRVDQFLVPKPPPART